MVRYRRNKPKNSDAVFFITAVTHQRKTILHNHYSLFEQVINRIQKHFKFEILAFVLMPDHFHFLLSPNDADYSKIMYSIKRGLSAELKRRNFLTEGRKVWQDRFWEHTIRDDQDLTRHLDYIHYNPVKHGLVKSPSQWAYSSFHSFLEKGIYTTEWGAIVPTHLDNMDLE